MSEPPPPYPGVQNEKGGYPPQAGYPPPQAGYPPPQGAYPPPQAGYPPSQQHQHTVVVTQPALSVVQSFRESPVRITCPHCRAEVVTATHGESGTFSWIVCVILCFIGCDLGCCLIPFCIEGCQDMVHTCPNCHQQVGRWNRM